MSVYDALNGSSFREINQPGRFDDLKSIKLEELTLHVVDQIHKRLKKSMLPMSNCLFLMIIRCGREKMR